MTGLGAIVTGGGAGLGRAVALGLAARGCNVAIVDIDAGAAGSAAAECAQRGGSGHPIVADLTSPGASQGIADRAAEMLGTVGILVNNAGYGTGEPFLAMTEAAWDRTLALNLRAVALMTAAVGRHMVERRDGRIVNVTSPASRMALPNYTAYAASKAGVDALTRAAALALAPHGIRVNSVAPGMMDTPMQRETERAFARIEGRDGDMEAFLAERTARIPIGRRLTTEEVAESVIWLALEAPDHVTAERLNASGGLDRD